MCIYIYIYIYSFLMTKIWLLIYMGCVCAFVVLLDGSAAEVKNSVISVWDLDLLALRGWSWWTPVNFDLLRGVVLKTITVTISQKKC